MQDFLIPDENFIGQAGESAADILVGLQQFTEEAFHRKLVGQGMALSAMKGGPAQLLVKPDSRSSIPPLPSSQMVVKDSSPDQVIIPGPQFE